MEALKIIANAAHTAATPLHSALLMLRDELSLPRFNRHV